MEVTLFQQFGLTPEEVPGASLQDKIAYLNQYRWETIPGETIGQKLQFVSDLFQEAQRVPLALSETRSVGWSMQEIIDPEFSRVLSLAVLTGNPDYVHEINKVMMARIPERSRRDYQSSYQSAIMEAIKKNYPEISKQLANYRSSFSFKPTLPITEPLNDVYVWETIPGETFEQKNQFLADLYREAETVSLKTFPTSVQGFVSLMPVDPEVSRLMALSVLSGNPSFVNKVHDVLVGRIGQYNLKDYLHSYNEAIRQAIKLKYPEIVKLLAHYREEASRLERYHRR